MSVTVEVTLETEQCCVCGVVFTLPLQLKTNLQRNGATFCCPNGHKQHFLDTQIAALKKSAADWQSQAKRLDKLVTECKTTIAQLQEKVKTLQSHADISTSLSVENLSLQAQLQDAEETIERLAGMTKAPEPIPAIVETPAPESP